MQFRSNFGELDKDITNMKIFLGLVVVVVVVGGWVWGVGQLDTGR